MMKPRVIHPNINELVSKNNWHLVEYKAKYGTGEIALAASDTLFYCGRLPALNRVIASRLDGMRSDNSNEESERVIKHILIRYVENPNALMRGDNILRLDSFPTLSKYFCDNMLRTNKPLKR